MANALQHPENLHFKYVWRNNRSIHTYEKYFRLNAFRDSDLIIKEVRLPPLDTENFLNMVEYKISEYTSSEDTPDMKNTVCDIIRNSGNNELGGCYSGDHMCLSVSENTILIVEHGIWD